MKIFSLLFCLTFLLFSCGEEPRKEETNIDKLIKLYPDSVDILIKHGNVMLERYNFPVALQDGAKAYRLQPKNIDARMLYALALSNQANRTTEEVLIAQKHFQYVVKKQPKNTKALVALASTYWHYGDEKEAFRFANTALRIDKKYRDAYVLKGTIYRQLGKIDLAISSYQTAIEQDKGFYEAYFMIGQLYKDQQNPQCIDYFRTCVELQPNNIDFMYDLAYSLQTLGTKNSANAEYNLQEAISIYRKMNQKNPKFAMSNFQIAYIKQFILAKPEIDSAIIYYNQSLQTEPMFVEAWHNLGLAYEEAGNKNYAIQAWRKALKYDKDFEKSKMELKKYGTVE